jgi:plasmid stability protein
MNDRQVEQFTIRGVPERVGARLRQLARQEGRSINAVAVEALARGIGLTEEEQIFTDLDDLSGTWVEDASFDRAIAEMDKVDEELWK